MNKKTKKPLLSFWQIWNMSFGFMGVQIGYSLQNANTSRILSAVGADPNNLSLFWLAAPLAGLIVQPIVGLFSDNVWTRFGRRIPFILGGAIVSALAMFLMPNSEHFTRFLPAVFFGATMLLLMDTSFNVTMQPFRALVSDMLDDSQRNKGYAIQSFLINVGAVVGSLLPFVLTNVFDVANKPAVGQKVAPTVIWAFYFGGGALLLSVLWTALKTKEYPPEEYAKYNDINEEEEAPMVSFWDLFKNIPSIMKQLAIVQFFSWFALFLMWVFTTQGIAKHVWGVDPYQAAFAQEVIKGKLNQNDLNNIKAFVDNKTNFSAFPYSKDLEKAIENANKYKVNLNYDYQFNDKTVKDANDAGDWTGVIFGAYSVFAALYSLLITRIVNKVGRKNTYAFSLILGGLGLISMLFFHNKYLEIISMLGVGIAWAAILAIPYAILSSKLPPKQTGVYMGLFNATITIPQITASLLGGVILTFVDGHAINMLVVAGASMIISGITAKIFINER